MSERSGGGRDTGGRGLVDRDAGSRGLVDRDAGGRGLVDRDALLGYAAWVLAAVLGLTITYIVVMSVVTWTT